MAEEVVFRYHLSKDVPYDIPEGENIWPEGVPGYDKVAALPEKAVEQTAEREEKSYFRFVSNIVEPALYAFPAKADKNCGKAVIVCPGGGYCGVAIDHEGFDIARFLNAQGISAFVLKYRVPSPNDTFGLLPEAPLNDAARAIRIVRSRAAKYGYDANKVGIMGFSSGGHVAVTASTLYNETKDDKYPGISARPDFSILIYPVISLYEGYGHTGSRNRLLGLDPDWNLMKRFSGEKMVTEDTPPAFLVSTDDDAVHPLNSLNYVTACIEHGVKAELHVYPEGGHGYGMRVRRMAIDSWIDRLKEWLERI